MQGKVPIFFHTGKRLGKIGWQGFVTNKCVSFALARILNVQRKRKLRLAYRACHKTQAALNLLKWPIVASRPDKVWMAAVTFIATGTGWSMTEGLNQSLVNPDLSMAIEQLSLCCPGFDGQLIG